MRSKNPTILTLPQFFKNNGYTTVGMGKNFDPRSVDKQLDKVSWSAPYMMPKVDHKVHGAPALSSYQSKENKEIFANLRAESGAEGLANRKLYDYLREKHKPSVESVDISDEGYFDGMLALNAIDQLGKLAKSENPFFLAVGFKKPHLPFVAPQKYWDMYQREKMPLAEFQQRAKGTVKLSYHSMGEIKSYTDIPEAFDKNGLLKEAKQRELIHGYYACVSYIDAQIGKILDALEAENLTKKTSIVLWGDHGWHLGDHGLWNKHSNFEQATRSPMIFADSDIIQGELNASPTEFVDIFPTLCDLAGLSHPEFLQGKSLKPILSGKKKSVKDFAISQYPRGNVMGYALRNERYRYVAWYKEKNTASEANVIVKELYDYKKDPFEKVNIAGSNPDLAQKLQSQLTQFLKEQSLQRKEFKKSQKVVKKKKKTASIGKPGKNLVKNAGFENGIENWRTGKDGAIEVVKGNAKSGKFSLQFTGTKCNAFQNIKSLKPETTYKVSVYAKTENKEPIIIKIREYGGEDITQRYQKANYGQITATFTTGKGNTSARIALLKYRKGATGKSWFDDISIQEVNDGTGSLEMKGPSLKGILNEKYNGELYVGATIGHAQLGTPVQDILTNEFNYTVAENAGKQARVHPLPNKWDWKRIDEIVKMAQKNNLVMRLHGPISPQASKWAKGDDRTGPELEQVMIDFMVEQCQRFNGHPNIKWMDVVNETVARNGSWFGPKPGVDKWENPWTIIGSDDDKNQTPLYISRAFAIANKYAPNISLVFNQHGGMEPPMWEKVKETILYLREKGLRVDGLGWQAHLRSNASLALDQDQLDYFASLIDWAHANKLDFHVTELDYKIMGDVNETSLEKQANVYANILQVLLSKRASGVVTFNTWGITDGVGKHKDLSRFMFDQEGAPKPAFFAIKNVLQNAENKLSISKNLVLNENFNTDQFPSSWKRYGKVKPDLDSKNGINGTACIVYSGHNSGINQLIEGLKPNTTYSIEVWTKAKTNQRITLKVSEYGGEEVKKYINGTNQFRKDILYFTTDASETSAKVKIIRWQPEAEGSIYLDNVKVYASPK